jgi:hypothetical protein
MRSKMVFLVLLMCFVAASGFSKPQSERPVTAPPVKGQDIEANIAKLLAEQKKTSEELKEISQRLDRVEKEVAEWHNQPPGPENRRPLISGDMPVMAKSGQSNYLQQSAVVEYFNKVRGIPRSTIEALVGHYISEAKLLDINHDIAIAQMCHATEFLTNDLWKAGNYANFNRDGAVWQGKSWNGTFPDIRTGVRAHIQHLKGYASTVSFNGDVDPRFHRLEGSRGKGDTLHKLCGLWIGRTPERARAYENNLIGILEGLYGFQERYNQRGLASTQR